MWLIVTKAKRKLANWFCWTTPNNLWHCKLVSTVKKTVMFRCTFGYLSYHLSSAWSDLIWGIGTIELNSSFSSLSALRTLIKIVFYCCSATRWWNVKQNNRNTRSITYELPTHNWGMLKGTYANILGYYKVRKVRDHFLCLIPRVFR